MKPPVLTVSNHDRDVLGLRYVYPVVSRRSGGVSIGINLNPNNACNWRCIYCQVPNLQRGAAPEIDLDLLETELTGLILRIKEGDFLQSLTADAAIGITDIALSGNGEPTSARAFPEVIARIARVRAACDLAPDLETLLITNGSLLHRPQVQDGLNALATMNGRIWFKLDRVTEAGRMQINQSRLSTESVRRNLLTALALCPTWLQTCWFGLDGHAPAQEEEDAYLDFLSGLPGDALQQMRGVLLYGVARPSMQPEAPRLSPLPLNALERFAARIRPFGLEVRVSA